MEPLLARIVGGDEIPDVLEARSAAPAISTSKRTCLCPSGRGVAVHASYLVNLAGPEPDFFERSIGAPSRLEITTADFGVVTRTCNAERSISRLPVQPIAAWVFANRCGTAKKNVGSKRAASS